jgi:hypothetical protein
MAKTTFDTSMSLDGFMTASHQTPEEPLGRGACACTNGRSAATRPTSGGWKPLSRASVPSSALAAPTKPRRGGVPTARPDRPGGRCSS